MHALISQRIVIYNILLSSMISIVVVVLKITTEELDVSRNRVKLSEFSTNWSANTEMFWHKTRLVKLSDVKITARVTD